MATINDPTVAANIARVGNVTYVPQHVTSGPFPIGSGGAYRASSNSGVMAASLAADSEIFQFRYVTAAARVALVHGISITATVLTLPATSLTVAAGPFKFRATAARAWTAAGSGGTRLTATTNNFKQRTAHATTEVSDIGISTTGALTAGTKTLDAQDIGSVLASLVVATAAGISTGVLVPRINLMGEHAAAMASPLILAHQEGFVIRIRDAFPATMTWAFTVDVAWSEVDAF